LNSRILIFLTLLSILALTVPGCGPVKDEDTPEGLTALGEYSLDSNNYADALRYYSMAVEKFPDHVLWASWQLGRGRSLLELGRLEEAFQAAMEAFQNAPDAHTKASARLLSAQIGFQGGSYTNAIVNLVRMDQESLDGDQTEESIQLIRSLLTRMDMDYLTSEPATGWSQVFFLLELEERYAAQGDAEKAVMVGMEIDRLFPDAHQRYGRPEIVTLEGGFIAVVLPLSGEGSTYAERVRTGVELAFERSSDIFRNSPDFITFDCSGDSAGIEEIMNSLGANPLCLGVIGPLTSRNAELAAPLAQSWSLPMITPTATSSNLDAYGSYVYRLVVSQGDEAAAVAEYAVRRAGCQRLAIIHEFTSESVSSAEQFSSVVGELGGEIVGMEGYETGATDYRDQINAIKYTDPDGVFLPVTAWDAIQLAPQLRFYRVDARLFGTSGWDDEILLEQGGEYVEEAVFPVSFGSGSMNPATARFSYFYQRRYDVQPNILAAQGYDTAEIILSAWQGSSPSRSSLESHLADTQVYFGATGMCSLGNVSIPRSAYPLVRVCDGEIVSIE
jgi:branched-chain amino acid transport system substrate-binding protein